ncbi:mediator of RNA polymerase II transcription subunit 25-like [Trichoplusia ni]|uniref:Mediator of RNA polymerase II transcription subunit 25 n=1 Tax=Trichoplusia ni TaxID=7111 RepID=A0A7E5VHJ5_TRINI|nr:mediator of RNA polymerase II transcription subunit 25-like [Trichoplusia ni]
MVVNAPDSPVQAEVIFVIEATAANGAYISELKTNYIVPTLEYFHGGSIEEGAGSGSVYSIVTYKAADCHPGLPVATFGPFTCPQNVVETVDKIQYIGGHAESRACVTEALSAALACFEELGRNDIPIHVLLLCCSPPYSAYAGGLVPPGAAGTLEQAARALAERGAHVSVAAARRVPALHALYEHAGGELHAAQQRNYAKDPRHLVLLRGYSLKERPPSPAPPPVPDIQADVYGQGRGAAVPARPGAAVFPRAGPAPPAPVGAGPGGQAVPGLTIVTIKIYKMLLVVGAAGVGRGAGNWLAPPRAPLYNNSALLTQLAQPSYPPPPPAHAAQTGHQRMPTMVTPGPSGAQLQRSYIWSGVIEWMEKGKAPGDQQKTTKHLPCQVSASTKDIEPELKVDTWPNKLLMQLMPKQLISNIGGQYLKDSKSVLFHLQPSEALDALTKVMVNGFAGCVHFSPMPTPPQCDIKVLILLYTPDKKAYLGFIPNNQATFVDRLRKVIQQQKISQIISKQQMPATVSAAGGMQPNMPNATMAGSGAMPPAGMSSGALGGAMAGAMQPGPGSVGNVGNVGGVGNMPGPGPSQGMVQSQMQQHPQGMMIGGGISQQVQQQQLGGKGPRPVTQLDGLEAARQQNLEKIQHLQQTLEAAHQQEAQFKSQMDIMSHLHAAQQQEQHYKQLEEQQRKHQLQQQLQQQLRGAGGAGHPARIMRPLLPSNPGLRHLLQQQPQYRPGGGAPRPASQPQQFDDVNNYTDFI